MPKQQPAAQTDKRPRTSQRMPERSTFFDRVLPPTLAFLALVTLGLILFAAGILLGLIPY